MFLGVTSSRRPEIINVKVGQFQRSWLSAGTKRAVGCIGIARRCEPGWGCYSGMPGLVGEAASGRSAWSIRALQLETQI